MSAARFIAALAEDAGNRVLRLDPLTLERLGGMHDRVLRLEFTDLRTSLYLVPSESGLRLLTKHTGDADVTLRGRLPAFARLGLGAREGLFFSGDLAIDGDVELGQRFQRAIEGIDIDWEEQLSRAVGDVVAHGVADVVRHAHAWQRRAWSILGEDLAEYLKEELRALPQPHSVDDYLRAVDELRADCDRLEQRVALLRGGTV